MNIRIWSEIWSYQEIPDKIIQIPKQILIQIISNPFFERENLPKFSPGFSPEFSLNSLISVSHWRKFLTDKQLINLYKPNKQ